MRVGEISPASWAESIRQNLSEVADFKALQLGELALDDILGRLGRCHPFGDAVRTTVIRHDCD